MTNRPANSVYVTGVAQDLYESCLIALIETLTAVGQPHWQAWMEEDLVRWRSNQDVSHHRSAYGGMGSFNDLWFAGGDPWFDETAEILREVGGSLGGKVERDPTQLVHIPTSVHGSVGTERCTACGATTVGESALERAGASAWASWWVPTCLKERRSVDICAGARGDIPAERDAYRLDARSRIGTDWIVVDPAERGGRPESCARCGSTQLQTIDVALY